VSSVQFLSGHRTDLAALGAYCAEHGLVFAVDAIQSVGHTPIDVQAMHIGLLVAGGQKSLMGPAGQGFLYVRNDLAAQMEPLIVGCNSTIDWIHWLRYDLTPLPGAARFGTGTPNIPGIIGLAESVELLLALGVAHIDAHTTALSRHLMAALDGKGYQVITPRAEGESGPNFGPIVTWHSAHNDAGTDALVTALAAEGVIVTKHWDAARNPYIRASFHCYNTQADSERLLSALEAHEDRLETEHYEKDAS
jgi:selenocysteine lyase/cysteine desulfurase